MNCPVPLFLPPMLAVRGSPFDSDAHWFEPKWDGIRCMVHSSTRIYLHSRSGRDITGLFPEIVARPLLDAENYLLDGELICLAPEGVPSFDRVRSRLTLSDSARTASVAREYPAVFIAFDLLYCDGRSLLDTPLEKRRALLENRFVPGGSCRLSPLTPREGKALFDAVARRNMEGIVAKALGSPYLPGKRSAAWIKVRRTRTDVFWLIGYSLDPGGKIRSLALADETADGLRYAGHVGSGMTEKEGERLLKLLAGSHHADPMRYGVLSPTARATEWIEPKIKVHVEYLERTPWGRLRHPVFRGVARPQGARTARRNR